MKYFLPKPQAPRVHSSTCYDPQTQAINPYTRNSLFHSMWDQQEMPLITSNQIYVHVYRSCVLLHQFVQSGLDQVANSIKAGTHLNGKNQIDLIYLSHGFFNSPYDYTQAASIFQSFNSGPVGIFMPFEEIVRLQHGPTGLVWHLQT